MEVFETDIAVVGAGPAGCSAAHRLAQNGVRVMLLEKASLPRYKTCGGGLVGRAWKMLPAGISSVVERECHAIELNFPQHGLHFVTKRDEPVILMTMRSALDHFLARKAVSAGTQLLESCAVISISNQPDKILLQTTAGCVQAKFAIAADGANSVVARQAGWNVARNTIPALECEIAVGEKEFDRLSKTARFDFGVVPEGYSWVFPKKEHLSVGVLTVRRGGVNLHDALKAYLGQLGISNPIRAECHGYMIPIRPREEPLGRGRIVLIGDAAGLADPVTAEGISYAIMSGEMAAQSLIDSRLDPADTLLCYETNLAKTLRPELKAARLLAWALYNNPRLCAFLFRRHGVGLSELVTDIVMGRSSYTTALRQPMNYLKLFRW